MNSPEVRILWLRIFGTITFAGADTVPGLNLILELVQRIVVTDARGEAISLTGGSARQWAQKCLGDAYADPPDVVAGGAGTVDFDMQLPIPFEFRKGQEPSDFRKPVSDFTGNGGQIKVQLGTGTLTSSGGTQAIDKTATSVEAYADTVDAGEKRSGSRLQLRDYVVNNRDFDYDVEGLLLAAWYSASSDDIVAGTTLSAQSYISRGLGYMLYDSTVLNAFERASQFSRSSVDDMDAGFAQSIYASGNYNSTAESPDLHQLNVRFSSAPATASQIVIVSITPRAESQVAAALGVSVAAVPAVIAGSMAATKTGATPRGNVHEKLAMFLPAKKGGKAAA